MRGDDTQTSRGTDMPAVSAPEEIRDDGADWLRAALLASAADGQAKLVVDVSGTQFADPPGLRMLVPAYERALAEGRAQGLLLPSVIVRRAPGIFWLSDLARKLPRDLSLSGCDLPRGALCQRTAGGRPPGQAVSAQSAQAPADQADRAVVSHALSWYSGTTPA
jgi:anti-anti-sigma regulatory factor